MNIIIFISQGNIHRTTQADINSSAVSRLSKVSDSSSLNLSICRRGGSKIEGRKPGDKNRSKVQQIVDELVNCGNPNQKLLTLKEVLRNPDLGQTNELINTSTSNSSSNTLYHFPLLFDLVKQCKTSTYRIRCTLISKAGIYVKVDLNAF